MSARCVRPDCDLPAAFRLAASFSERIGWLCDLDPNANPHDYLLCARHADALTLPINWELHDQRSPRLAPVPPPGPPSHPPAPESAAPRLADPEPEPAPAPASDELDFEEPEEQEEPEQPAAAGFEYDPASEVDESTPLLSRAFRAAVPGDARH